MPSLIKDLASYNRKHKLTNGDVISFSGQYATNVSDADVALLFQKNSGEFVLGVQAQVGSGGLASYVSTQNTANINTANTALTANQSTNSN